jgi:hypothetical protein
MTVDERLRAALRSANPAVALRALVLDLAREGQTKAAIYEAMLNFLVRHRQEEDHHESDDDALEGVMDALTGWCHTSAKLLPDEKPA